MRPPSKSEEQFAARHGIEYTNSFFDLMERLMQAHHQWAAFPGVAGRMAAAKLAGALGRRTVHPELKEIAAIAAYQRAKYYVLENSLAAPDSIEPLGEVA